MNEKHSSALIVDQGPKVLVIDGIAMGILKTELHKYKHEIVQELANKSKKEFEGSNFRDRMFI